MHTRRPFVFTYNRGRTFFIDIIRITGLLKFFLLQPFKDTIGYSKIALTSP